MNAGARRAIRSIQTSSRNSSAFQRRIGPSRADRGRGNMGVVGPRKPRACGYNARNGEKVWNNRRKYGSCWAHRGNDWQFCRDYMANIYPAAINRSILI